MPPKSFACLKKKYKTNRCLSFVVSKYLFYFIQFAEFFDFSDFILDQLTARMYVKISLP
jgi:hypothetical protein